MQAVRAYIFDVDGVLVDSMDAKGNFHWSRNIETELGFKKSDLPKIFSSGWFDALKGRLDTKEHLRNVFSQLPDCAVTVEQFVDYWLAKDTRFNKDVLGIANDLQHAAYLGTNQDPYRAAALQASIGENFRGIFASSAIGFMKPEPEFYAHIESALNLPPAEIMLIDDHHSNIEVAKGRGWQTHHFKGDAAALRQSLGI